MLPARMLQTSELLDAVCAIAVAFGWVPPVIALLLGLTAAHRNISSMQGKQSLEVQGLEARLETVTTELLRMSRICAEASVLAEAARSTATVACKDARSTEALAISARESADTAAEVANRVNATATRAMSAAEQAVGDSTRALAQARAAVQQARDTQSLLERERSAWQQVLEELT